MSAVALLLVVAPASAFADWAQQSPSTAPAARAGPAFAFDGASNVDVLFGGMSGAWSAESLNHGNALTGISCASTTFCVATDGSGDIYAYNGTSWSADTSNTTSALNDVSCWSTDCTAVGAGGTIDTTTNSGSTWSATTHGTTAFNAIGCDGAKANGNACVAAGAVSGSEPVTYANYNGGTSGGAGGTTWASETNASGNAAANAESCIVSATDCLTVGASGSAAYSTSDGTSWSSITSPGSGISLNGVACWYDSGYGPVWCMAVGSNGYAYGFISASSTTSFPGYVDVDGSNDLTAISCPDASTSSNICVAVDSSGHAVTWSQTENAWSAPIDIDGANDLTGVSCVSASFCVAVDSSGNVITFNATATYNGDTWQYKASTDTWTSESPSTKPTAREGAALTYDATSDVDALFGGQGAPSWSAATSVDTANTNSVPSVSCASGTFCALVDANGKAATYSGGSWSATTAVNGSSALRSVSCVSSTFCVAVGAGGNAFTYNGSSWSGASNIDGTNTLTGVSCATTSFCVAVDSANKLFEYTGSWSSSISDGTSGFAAVSCPSTTFCEAIDGSSDAWKYTGGSWSASSWTETTSIDGESEAITAVSCASSSFCMAVDNASASDGDALVYNGSGWETMLVIDGSEGLRGISCVSSSFCIATDGDGHVLTWNAGFWSGANDVDGTHVVGGISCASATFCATGDESGNALVYGPTYDSDTWQYKASTDAWTSESPSSKPSARSGAALAYDAATGTDVLFGGLGAGGYDGDTWQYNAASDTWTQESPSTAPSARAGASLGYDSDTGLFVLFGGQGNGGYDGDTWLYNASTDTWTQQSPSTSPAARAFAGTAATPTELLIEGGASASGEQSDTWAYYGGNWVQQSPAVPVLGDAPAMAYDANDGAAVLFGGEFAPGSNATGGDTWLGSFTSLGFLAPTSLSWPVTLDGFNQTTDAAATLTVDDTAGAGWNLEVTATTPTSGSNTLSPVTINGSSSSATATTAPTVSCVGGAGTCSTPTGNLASYPLTVPNGSPASLYTANSGTGADDVSLATDWWLSTVANSPPGTYSTTITLTVVSGP